jgi:hypothetical protein
MIKTAEAIKSLDSTAEFSIMHGDTDVITWVTTPMSDAEITAEVTRLQAEFDSNQYQRDRATDYPAIADQLDDIFHNGIDGWKATIQLTKDKYPKGGN